MSRSLKNIARLLDSVNNDMPAEQDFLADLKRSIELTEKKNTGKPSLTYKPSSMKCVRSMYYQVTGAEVENSDVSYCLIGICNSGTDIHIRIQQAIEDMKDNGIDCEYIDVAKFIEDRKIKDVEVRSKSGMETKLYHTKLNMSFMCDGIIKYKNHYYILELKTETSYKWGMRKGVAEEHHAQATAYSIALNLPEILFVYISRDNLDMKSYMYVPTDEEKEMLIGKIEECDTCIKEHRVPAKPDLPKGSCNYCLYKKQCGLE